MINNNAGFQPNFTSTYIPKVSKFNWNDAALKLSNYFEVKGFGKITPEKMREQIKLGQAGLGFDRDASGTAIFVGKDREADEFIARQLRAEDIHINYIQDTPETVFKDKPINGNDLKIDFDDLEIDWDALKKIDFEA